MKRQPTNRCSTDPGSVNRRTDLNGSRLYHGSKLLPTKPRPRSHNLSNKNQVKSLSVTVHPTMSMSLSYKSTDSPSVVSKSSSVTSVTSQISLSSVVPYSSSSWSSCVVQVSSSTLSTLTVSSLIHLSSSWRIAEQPPLPLSFFHTMSNTVTPFGCVPVGS